MHYEARPSIFVNYDGSFQMRSVKNASVWEARTGMFSPLGEYYLELRIRFFLLKYEMARKLR